MGFSLRPNDANEKGCILQMDSYARQILLVLAWCGLRVDQEASCERSEGQDVIGVQGGPISNELTIAPGATG